MKNINIENFDEFKENFNNNENDFVIINIGASWCKPCNNIKKDLNNYINNFNCNNGIFLKIDHDLIEDDDQFSNYFTINKIPYFIIYKYKSKIKEFQTGDIEIIKNEISSCISKNEENNLNLSLDF